MLLTDVPSEEWLGKLVRVKRMTHSTGAIFVFQGIVVEVARPNPKRKGLPYVKVEPLRTNGNPPAWKSPTGIEIVGDR